MIAYLSRRFHPNTQGTLAEGLEYTAWSPPHFSSTRGNLRAQHRMLEDVDLDVSKTTLEMAGETSSKAEETSVHVRMFPAPQGANW